MGGKLIENEPEFVNDELKIVEINGDDPTLGTISDAYSCLGVSSSEFDTLSGDLDTVYAYPEYFGPHFEKKYDHRKVALDSLISRWYGNQGIDKVVVKAVGMPNREDDEAKVFEMANEGDRKYIKIIPATILGKAWKRSKIESTHMDILYTYMAGRLGASRVHLEGMSMVKDPESGKNVAIESLRSDGGISLYGFKTLDELHNYDKVIKRDLEGTDLSREQIGLMLNEQGVQETQTMLAERLKQAYPKNPQEDDWDYNYRANCTASGVLRRLGLIDKHQEILKRIEPLLSNDDRFKNELIRNVARNTLLATLFGADRDSTQYRNLLIDDDGTLSSIDMHEWMGLEQNEEDDVSYIYEHTVEALRTQLLRSSGMIREILKTTSGQINLGKDVSAFLGVEAVSEKDEELQDMIWDAMKEYFMEIDDDTWGALINQMRNFSLDGMEGFITNLEEMIDDLRKIFVKGELVD